MELQIKMKNCLVYRNNRIKTNSFKLDIKKQFREN
jgi:hypothetical protein